MPVVRGTPSVRFLNKVIILFPGNVRHFAASCVRSLAFGFTASLVALIARASALDPCGFGKGGFGDGIVGLDAGSGGQSNFLPVGFGLPDFWGLGTTGYCLAGHWCSCFSRPSRRWGLGSFWSLGSLWGLRSFPGLPGWLARAFTAAAFPTGDFLDHRAVVIDTLELRFETAGPLFLAVKLFLEEDELLLCFIHLFLGLVPEASGTDDFRVFLFDPSDKPASAGLERYLVIFDSPKGRHLGLLVFKRMGARQEVGVVLRLVPFHAVEQALESFDLESALFDARLDLVGFRDSWFVVRLASWVAVFVPAKGKVLGTGELGLPSGRSGLGLGRLPRGAPCSALFLCR